MAPGVILARCRENGIELRADGDHLRLRGPAAGREKVRALIAAHKPELLALLTAPPCPACGKTTDEKRRCWGCHDRPCEVCGRPTGSAFIATCAPCGNALPDGN